MRECMLPECVLVVGPSGCGKTHVVLNEIIEHQKYDYIFILCPTLGINETYGKWNGLKDDCVFGLDISASKLEYVITFIISQFSGDDCRTAVIIDDMSNSTKQHLNFGKITYLAYSGRHHGISLFLLSQKLSSVSTGIRDNTTRIVFFPTHCKRSIKTLRDEFLGCLSDADEKDLVRKLKDPKIRYVDLRLTERKLEIKHK